MRISFGKKYITIRKALSIGGYTYRAKQQDFFREEENGRFHVIFEDQKPIIHFDLYVEWRHVTFTLPLHLKKEIARIRIAINKYHQQKHANNNRTS